MLGACRAAAPRRAASQPSRSSLAAACPRMHRAARVFWGVSARKFHLGLSPRVRAGDASRGADPLARRRGTEKAEIAVTQRDVYREGAAGRGGSFPCCCCRCRWIRVDDSAASFPSLHARAVRSIGLHFCPILRPFSRPCSSYRETFYISRKLHILSDLLCFFHRYINDESKPFCYESA